MKKIKLLVFETDDNPDAHIVARQQADVILQELEDHPGYRIIKSKYDWNFPVQSIIAVEE